jgi:arabinofuranan 3-O-arabinosyltransferase
VRAAAVAGRELDPGTMGRGSYDGVRVQVSAPSWLVLGESYNRGWRAECDGKSLGAPQVVDGYANGWPVKPGCGRVSLTFGPQKAVWWGYAIGALACLVLLGILLLRRPRRAPESIEPPLEIDDSPWRLPFRRALLAGVAASLVFGFLFALRAGVVIGPVVALVLWRGMSPRAMLMTAGALLAIVVPALYLIFPANDHGGFDTSYPVERLGAHWVTVGAVVLLIFALVSTASRASRARAGAAAAAGPAPPARP